MSRHEDVFWDSNTDDDVIRKQLQAVLASRSALGIARPRASRGFNNLRALA